MPGRTVSSSAYRYGFNGKENDNDVKGAGNQQDYGMRIYDPRLGKFLSVDPLGKDYPNFTPFQYAGNSPIGAIDLDGLEGWELSTQLGILKRNAEATLTRLQNGGASTTGSNSNQASGMNLGTLKMQKKAYSGTSWVSLNPENTKMATFANNAAVSAWNQGVGSVEFASKIFTKQGRKEQEKIVTKALWKGLMWFATTDDNAKMQDVKDAVSDVNNWEDLSGSILLGSATANFGRPPVGTPAGIGLNDIGRVGRRLVGLSDRKLNDLEIRIFGSAVKGAANPNDLDVLLITSNTDLFKPGSRLDKIIQSIKTDFKNSTGKDLDVNIMTPETFRRAQGGAFKADVDKSSIRLNP